MFEGGKDDSRCRLCGAKLSLIQRLSRAEFCSAEHQAAFKRDQERLALERLGLSTTAPVAQAPPEPEPEPEPEAASDGQYESFIIDEPVEEPAFEEHIPAMAGFLFQGSYATYGQVPCMEECDPLASEHSRMRLPSLRPRGGRSSGWTPERDADRLLDVARSCPGSTASAWLEPTEIDFAGVMAFPGGPPVVPFSPDDAGIKVVQPDPGDPPMAGLAPLPGPQTLRFEPNICRTEALPEDPEPHQPSRKIRQEKPEKKEKHARLRLAGNVRGVWRTRIGQAGQFTPRSEEFVPLGAGAAQASIPGFSLRIVDSPLFGGAEDGDSAEQDLSGAPPMADPMETAAEPEQAMLETAPQIPVEPPKPEPSATQPPKADTPRAADLILAKLQGPPKPASAPAPPRPAPPRQEPQRPVEQVDLALVPRSGRLPIRLTAPNVSVAPWAVTPLDLIWFKLAHVRSEIEAGLKPQCAISWAPLDVAAVKGRDPLAQPLPAKLLTAIRLPKAPRRKKSFSAERVLRSGGEVPIRIDVRTMPAVTQRQDPADIQEKIPFVMPVPVRGAMPSLQELHRFTEVRQLVSVFVVDRDCQTTSAVQQSGATGPISGAKPDADSDSGRLKLLRSQWRSASGSGGGDSLQVPVAKGPSVWEIAAPPPPAAAMMEPLSCSFETGGEAWDSQS